MTDTSFDIANPAAEGARLSSGAEVADYVALLKPRVMSLVVFTGFAGLFVAPGTLHPLLAAVAVLCIAVGAGAAGATFGSAACRTGTPPVAPVSPASSSAPSCSLARSSAMWRSR